MDKIPYTLPYFSEREITAVNDILTDPQKIMSELYTKKSRDFLKHYYQKEVLLTHSCTAALEMSALLLNLKPGDEIICPSYTFVSTANAFALFGAKLVFIDSEEATLNIDAKQIAAAITPRTKAIIVMHYAGVACDLKTIGAIAAEKNIPIIEDAAQCIGANYFGKPLGTFGALGTLSFHNTKNITSGLGGALIINDPNLIERAKIICQKGTNRDAFLDGFVDKYTWQDLGSSYMMTEIGAALLHGQLQRMDEITTKRLSIWNRYHVALTDLELKQGYQRPTLLEGRSHNAHIYFLIAPTEDQANRLRQHLASKGITAPLHYVPLHLSPAGQHFAGQRYSLPVCENLYKRIIRLPIWEGVENHQERIIEEVYRGLSPISSRPQGEKMSRSDR